MRRVYRAAISSTVALLAAAGAAHAQSPAALIDPAALGSHTVLTNILGSDTQRYEINGVLNENLSQAWYPADLNNGPYPLVLFLHGDHGTCMQANGLDTTDLWPCEAGNVPIPSYQGYDYVATKLASHGMFVVSISANGMNVVDDMQGDGGAQAPREQLIANHLAGWHLSTNGWGTPAIDDRPDVTGSVVGAIDMQNIALVGHSMGGQAIMTYVNTFNETYWRFSALLPIGTVGAAYTKAVPLATLNGYCDGDTFNLHGLRLFDSARYGVAGANPEKYSFTLLGANHNYFNSVWTPGTWWKPAHATDDINIRAALREDSHCNAAGRLTGQEQRDVASAYIMAYLRRHVLGETQFDPYLRGDVAPPPSALTTEVRTAFMPATAERLDLDRLNDEAMFARGENNRAGVTNGPSLPDNFQLCSGGNCLRQGRTGNSQTRLSVKWGGAGVTYTTGLPAFQRNVSSYTTLQLRVGVDHNDETQNVPEGQNFRIELRDSSGRRASVDVADFSDALLFPPGDDDRVRVSLMSTVRIPMAMFMNVNLASVASVNLVFDQEPSGSLFVSDIAFASDGTSNTDGLWLADGSRDFVGYDMPLSSEYRPMTGDFDGDGADDIFLYAPGTGNDVILWADGDGTFTPQVRSVKGEYIPIVGDFDGDDADDIFWYAPGSAVDSIWWSDGDRTFTATTPSNVSGTYQPLAGDFDGDGSDDILWYRPGSESDSIWWSDGDRTFTSLPTWDSINGTYELVAGDFDGDEADDILFYRPGTASDAIWWSDGDRTFTSLPTWDSINGTYELAAGDFDDDGRDDILFYRAGTPTDAVWWSDGDRTFTSLETSDNVMGTYQPLIGDFDGDQASDIFWYNP